MQARVPRPALGPIVRSPRWLLAISVAMASPSPDPPASAFVVKKGLAARAACSVEIPAPSSVTTNATLSASARAATSTCSPGWQASQALRSRFTIACSSSARSHWMGGIASGMSVASPTLRLREAVLDRSGRGARDLRRVGALERRRAAPRHVEEPPHDLLDPVGLLQDGLRAMDRAFVVLDPPEELLRPPHDDAEGRRHLVGDAHGERSHRRQALSFGEGLVAAALDLGDGELARELELLSLLAQGETSEREDEPRRDEDAEHEPARGALLAVPLARCAGDRGDAPTAQCAGVDVRQPGHRRSGRQADLRRLRALEPQRADVPVERRAQSGRGHGSPVGRVDKGSPGDRRGTR